MSHTRAVMNRGHEVLTDNLTGPGSPVVKHSPETKELRASRMAVST